MNPNSTAYHPVGFQLLTALLQLPHIDVEKEIERRTAGALTAADKDSLRKRLSSARYWLDHLASEDDRIELQQQVPDSVYELSESQRAFLNLLGSRFPTGRGTEDEYQRFIFDTARLTPIDQKSAFQAIYRALLDKPQGPKGGALLSYLDADFLIDRFSGIAYSVDGFWEETCVTKDACEAWLSGHEGSIQCIEYALLLNAVIPPERSPDSDSLMQGKSVLEIYAKLDDGKEHRIRVLLSELEAKGRDLPQEAERLQTRGQEYIGYLSQKLRLRIAQRGKVETSQEDPDPSRRFPPAHRD